MTSILGLVAAGAVAICGLWIKWKLNRAQKDRVALDQATKTTAALVESLKSNMKAGIANEKAIVEIFSRPLPDSRVSELLSEPIVAGKDAYPQPSANGKSPGRKVSPGH